MPCGLGRGRRAAGATAAPRGGRGWPALLPVLVMADLLGAHWRDVPTIAPAYWTGPRRQRRMLRADPGFIRVFGLAGTRPGAGLCLGAGRFLRGPRHPGLEPAAGLGPRLLRRRDADDPAPQAASTTWHTTSGAGAVRRRGGHATSSPADSPQGAGRPPSRRARPTSTATRRPTAGPADGPAGLCGRRGRRGRGAAIGSAPTARDRG